MSREKMGSELQDENLEKEEILTNEHEEDQVESGVADKVAEDDWEQKYNQVNDAYLRLNAEFDNYRKRTLKEKAELLKMGGERVLLDVINIVDDFERALDTIKKVENNNAVVEGIELIYNKFTSFLAKHGVTEIKAIGELFDVDKHEAITTIPASKEEDKNRIVDCIQKGYMLDDKVIRFPKVIVAK